MRLAILITILLSGCATSVPVARNFPAVPESLTVKCPVLQTVDPTTTKLSDVVSTVSANYGQYHECAGKVEDWATWYKTQKEIFDSVK